MMKKYVLPSLVSLALSSSWTLAEQSQTPETPEVSPPAIMQPSDEAIKQHLEQMEKQRAQMQEQMEKQKAQMQEEMEKQKAEWMAHRQEMQGLMDKIQQTTDPEERQRLMEELQQQRQKMYENKMQAQGGMMPPKPHYGPNSGYGPRSGYGPGPRSGYGPGPYYGPRRGYHGPYNRRGQMPNIPRPNYNMPYNRDGGMPEGYRPDYYKMPYNQRGEMPRMPGGFGKEKRGGHHAQVEQRLEKIEKLLEQLVELSKEK